MLLNRCPCVPWFKSNGQRAWSTNGNTPGNVILESVSERLGGEEDWWKINGVPALFEADSLSLTWRRNRRQAQTLVLIVPSGGRDKPWHWGWPPHSAELSRTGIPATSLSLSLSLRDSAIGGWNSGASASRLERCSSHWADEIQSKIWLHGRLYTGLYHLTPGEAQGQPRKQRRLCRVFGKDTRSTGFRGWWMRNLNARRLIFTAPHPLASIAHRRLLQPESRRRICTSCISSGSRCRARLPMALNGRLHATVQFVASHCPGMRH